MIDWVQLFFGWLVGIPTGLALSYFIKFRKLHDNSSRIIPVFNFSFFRSKRFLSGFVVLFFVAATAQIVTYTYTERAHWNELQARNEIQQRCNAEFRRVIAERAKTGAEDSRLRVDNDNAGLDALTALLSLNPADPGRAESSRRIIQDYRDRLYRNNTKQAQNERMRAANPYPDPRC